MLQVVTSCERFSSYEERARPPVEPPKGRLRWPVCGSSPSCPNGRFEGYPRFRSCMARFTLRLALLFRLVAIWHPQAASECDCSSRLRARSSLLFLDVMLDHLGEHRHFGVEIILIGGHALDLGKQLLGAIVLDHSFVMDVLVLRCPQECGVEDLLLDRGMNGRASQILEASCCFFAVLRAPSNSENHPSTCRWSALRSDIASWAEVFLRGLGME
jgi:hypothetical protein